MITPKLKRGGVLELRQTLKFLRYLVRRTYSRFDT